MAFSAMAPAVLSRPTPLIASHLSFNRNGRVGTTDNFATSFLQDHTTAVCVSLQWSRGLRVVRLPAGSWHGLPRW